MHAEHPKTKIFPHSCTGAGMGYSLMQQDGWQGRG